MGSVTRNKQPWEKLPYSMEFVRRIPSGESLDAVSSIEPDPDDGTITITSKSVSGTKALCVIDGGTDGSTYKIEFRVTTTPSGYQLEDDGTLAVAD